MKIWQKILLAIFALILIGGIIFGTMFFLNENKMKEYSTYCMDKVRYELGEYLENIHMNGSICDEGTCVYMGGVTYEGVDYGFSCKVYNKENIELSLEPLYPEEEPIVEEFQEDIHTAKMRVLGGQTEEETQAMVEEACGNMGGTWTDGSCMLEDGSYVNF